MNSANPDKTRKRSPWGTSFRQDIDQAVRILGNANIVVESAESSYLGANVLPANGPHQEFDQYTPDDRGAHRWPVLSGRHQRSCRDIPRCRQRPGNKLRDRLLRPWQLSTRPRADPDTHHTSERTLRAREGFYVEKDQPAKPTEVRVNRGRRAAARSGRRDDPADRKGDEDGGQLRQSSRCD